jgi:hypothetical protein
LNANTLIPILIGLILLDLLLTIIRSSMVNAHLPQLLNLRDDQEFAVDRTLLPAQSSGISSPGY